ncbi:TraR/DksA C4-type zinc finger protein [Marinicrinis lubricantis]|uniref:TraR/DksA C4-type zinc finger protein n=1 Tax=Marinicrinis lubricantis TaxID=2086470 RepID=A0ABW1ISC3_9BACL
MNHLSQAELEQLTQQLREEQHDLERRLKDNDSFQFVRSLRDSTGELSTNDNHPADTATEIYEREKDIALNEQYELHLEDIDTAFRLIEEGMYGICQVCSKPIPFERLQAHPTARYCVNHTLPNDDISRRRPAEEDYLQPPFGRTSQDELDEQNQFDGEDAWQIVESYGNSSSPAFAEQSEVSDYNDMYIESDEPDGYVQPIESFLATDLYGRTISVIRNREYQKYMENDADETISEDELGMQHYFYS